ncbi:MAG: LysM peptidoglycan-binding domain-containing protein [Anaerolineales bacterium]|nr:LysM peptidoglycan-binding domain-containing protein [Anaerolineales bacterium]
MRRQITLAVLLIGLAACGSSPDPGPASVSDGPQPYQTSTPSPTLTPAPPLTEILVASPTPLTHTVQQGDTLSGIALRFNVAIEDLLIANPGLSPTALSIGTTLIIPVGGNVSGEPTPTPVPLPVHQARCWPTREGGAWCFALLQNAYAETLENLSAQFALLTPSGEQVASQVVFGSLNILPPGGSLPLAAYFPPPVPAEARLRVQLLTVIRLLPGDMRYLPAVIQNSRVEVAWSGQTAQASGQVLLTVPGDIATTAWVLAVAYDAAGNVVSLRRWESTSPLTGGTATLFELTLSSVGPPIDRVELLVEARP